jgi:hypothetical protein
MAKTFNLTHLIQVPPQTSLSFRTLDPLFANAGLGFGFGGLDAIAARQVARENHSVAKAKVPCSKHGQKRKPVPLVPAPSTLALIMPPGNGTKTLSPLGENFQGPSLVDYELELKAKFPPKMVLEMQEGAI